MSAKKYKYSHYAIESIIMIVAVYECTRCGVSLTTSPRYDNRLVYLRRKHNRRKNSSHKKSNTVLKKIARRNYRETKNTRKIKSDKLISNTRIPKEKTSHSQQSRAALWDTAKGNAEEEIETKNLIV